MHKIYRVGIDAGHGGKNKGTCAWGLIEKNINLIVAEKLRTELVKRPGIRVTMIRMEDETVGFRGRKLRGSHCDMVICLHVNALSKRTVHGAECYYQHGSSESEELAKALLESMPKELRTKRCIDAYDDPDREGDEWKNAPRRVLCHKLCALVELGYASNELDLKLLSSPLYQSNIANCLASCIFEVIEAKTKTKKKGSENAKSGNNETPLFGETPRPEVERSPRSAHD